MRSSSTTDGRLWLALFATLSAGSVALAAGLALAHSVGALSWPPSREFSLSAWQALFSHGAFWRSLVYSVTLTCITLVLAVMMALLLFAVLGPRLRHGLLARVLFLPLAVPPVVAALMGFILLADSGWLSRLAHGADLVSTPADFPALIFDGAGRGIVLTHLAMVTPLFVLLFDELATHLRLPLLMQQASALGARRGQAWRRIALPLLLRQARPVLAVYGVVLLGAYEVPLLLGAPAPSMVSVTIQRAVAGYDVATRPLGYAMASVYLVVLVTGWALLRGRAAPQASSR